MNMPDTPPWQAPESLIQRLRLGRHGLRGKLALVLILGLGLSVAFALSVALYFAPELLAARSQPSETVWWWEPGSAARLGLCFALFWLLCVSGMVLNEEHLARTLVGGAVGLGWAWVIAHAYLWHLDALTAAIGLAFGAVLGCSAHLWAACLWQLAGDKP